MLTRIFVSASQVQTLNASFWIPRKVQPRQVAPVAMGNEDEEEEEDDAARKAQEEEMLRHIQEQLQLREMQKKASLTKDGSVSRKERPRSAGVQFADDSAAEKPQAGSSPTYPPHFTGWAVAEASQPGHFVSSATMTSPFLLPIGGSAFTMEAEAVSSVLVNRASLGVSHA